MFYRIVELQGRNGPKLDAGVCGAVISSCEKNGQWSEAIKIFYQVKKLCNPKSGKKRKLLQFPAVVSAMRACRRGHQIDTALSLLKLDNISSNAKQMTILTNLAAATILETDPSKHTQALSLLQGKLLARTRKNIQNSKK